MLIDFIHVGYPKSGSTWLQNNIFPNIPNLCILNPIDTSLGLFFLDEFVFDNHLQFDKSLFINKFRDYTSSNLNCTNNSILGISEENLLGDVFNGKDVKLLAEKIKYTFGSPQILFILRSQPSLIISTYSQYVFHGGTLSFNNYINNYNTEGWRLFHKLNFNLTIKLYAEVFGHNNLNIYFLEDIVADPKKLNSFFSKFDIELNESCLSSSNKSRNKGFSFRESHLRRHFNKFSIRLNQIIPSVSSSSNSEIRHLITKYPSEFSILSDSNLELADNFKLSLPPSYVFNLH